MDQRCFYSFYRVCCNQLSVSWLYFCWLLFLLERERVFAFNPLDILANPLRFFLLFCFKFLFFVQSSIQVSILRFIVLLIIPWINSGWQNKRGLVMRVLHMNFLNNFFNNVFIFIKFSLSDNTSNWIVLIFKKKFTLNIIGAINFLALYF